MEKGKKLRVEHINLGTVRVRELLMKRVTEIGDGAHVLVPKSWLNQNKKIIVILPDSVELNEEGQLKVEGKE